MAIGPGTRLGPYEIVALVGAGAMGDVYRARDSRLARDVAVKVLPPVFAGDADRLRRFETEARSAGALNHPNIVAVYDTGVADGVPYVVEELLEGGTLRHALAHGPLSPRRVVEIAVQVARGLAAAGERGIVHRDLKPENLFVTRDGQAKILDFGLARMTTGSHGAPSSDSLTQAATAAGVLLGTAGYMAPEQLRGKPADHRSDLFALGVVMHEMLDGARPFARGTPIESMHAILHADPPELSGTPPALARIVRRCLEKQPTRRFQSAHDLAFALEALPEFSGASSAPASSAPASSAAAVPALRPARAGRRGRALAGVVVLAAVLAAATLGWTLGRGRQPAVPGFTQLSFRSGSIDGALFTADSRHAVFAASWDGAVPDVYEVPFDFPAARSLGLPSRRMLAISRTDELALGRGRPSYPFYNYGCTLERVNLQGGSPRAIADTVWWADFSPDGAALAVIRESESRMLLEYPLGHVLLASTEFGLRGARVSRDGRSVACIEHPILGDDRGRVIVVDAAGRARTVTQDFETISGLAWSADGREIWFSAGHFGFHRTLWSVRPGHPARERFATPLSLYIADIARNGDALVVSGTLRVAIHGRLAGDAEERDLSWFDVSAVSDLSPDGRIVLFDEESESAGPLYAACLRRAEDPAPVRLGDGIPMELSPDGNVAVTFVPSTPQRILLLPTGTGQPRAVDLGPLALVTTAASWMPDGRHILVSGAPRGRPESLWLLDVGGGPPLSASPEGYVFGVGHSRRVSPDGRLVFCYGPGVRLGNFDLQTRDFRPLPGATPDLKTIGWSADGRGVLVYSDKQSPAPVYLVDPATGDRRLLFEIRRAPWETIRTVRVAADLRSYVYTTESSLDALYLVRGLR